MNQLAQSMGREGGGRFGFLSRGLAYLARPSVAVWAPIPLRLIVGCGFMEHGFAKLSRGPDTFAGILHALAVPAPHFMAWATIVTELIGGLGIFLGAFIVNFWTTLSVVSSVGIATALPPLARISATVRSAPSRSEA